jgi:hypothetical protein
MQYQVRLGGMPRERIDDRDKAIARGAKLAKKYSYVEVTTKGEGAHAARTVARWTNGVRNK